MYDLLTALSQSSLVTPRGTDTEEHIFFSGSLGVSGLNITNHQALHICITCVSFIKISYTSGGVGRLWQLLSIRDRVCTEEYIWGGDKHVQAYALLANNGGGSIRPF